MSNHTKAGRRRSFRERMNLALNDIVLRAEIAKAETRKRLALRTAGTTPVTERR